MKKQYELMVIIKGSLPDDKKKDALLDIEKTLEKSGKIIKKDDLGKRLLAYKISSEKDGEYYIFTIDFDGTKIKKLNTIFKQKENILRHLFVKV